MKQFFVFTLMLLSNCTTDEVKDFIPGTYTRHYVDEYTDSYDTVKISFITEHGSSGYAISKRMRYRKKLDGTKLPEQYKVQDWTGRYDAATKTIFIEQTGNQIYFDPIQRQLKLGIMPYNKIP